MERRTIQYITGILRENNHKMLQINGMPDHIHIFLWLRPHQSISSLTQKIKTESTNWIMTHSFCKAPFAWQEGFGAFSYSKSHVQDVIRYIQLQETHQKTEKFLDEYHRLRNAFEIEYNERYIFKEPC